jgi:GT2 family glycosyltransferase
LNTYLHKVSVVILNWNGKKYLEKYLPSLIKNTPSFAEIIIADNASTDDSVKFVNENYPQLRIVINAENGGFAKGYNDALKNILSEYYLLLNSDIEVAENWLEPLVNLLDTNKNIAACQPKIRAYMQKEYFEHAGAAGGFIDKHGFTFCRGRIFDYVEKDTNQYNLAGEIFWASGACLLIRSELFKQLNGFDEDFFAHMEEIDLCWRLKNMGYQIWYEPKATVYHLGGGTLNYNNPNKIYLNFRNNLFLLLKNWPGKGLYRKLFFRMLLDGIAGLYFLLNGRFAYFIAVIKAHFSFYASFSKFKRKRYSPIKSGFGNTVYNKSIIWSFFVKKKKQFSQLEF